MMTLLYLLTFAVFVLATSGCHVQSQRLQHPLEKMNVLRIHTANIPTIDGKLNEAIWRNARPIQLEYLINGPIIHPTDTAGDLRMLLCNDMLYVGVVVFDTDIFSNFTNRDDRLWHQDAIEIFFKPDVENSLYFEFQFSPAGVIYDARWPNQQVVNPQLLHRKWNGENLQWETHIQGTLNQHDDTDQQWSLEVAIPLKTLLIPGIETQPHLPARCLGAYFNHNSSDGKRIAKATAPLQKTHQYEYWNNLFTGQ
jgi:hypothetical protein